MAPPDVCPTKDAVQAFLEHLVDPMLPAKSSVRDNPTPFQQQSVAKQVPSVVLLYNYYHRKQHPELEYLEFNGFCINKTDITLLESYTVYSQSKEKSASLFYIMQCSQLINEESLRGPLVKKSSSSWTITPVVQYFHVLPYSQIISEWLSREAFSSSLQDSRVVEKNIMVDSPKVTESCVSEGMSIGLGSKPSSDNIESLKQKENSGRCTLRLSNSIKEPQDTDVDNSSIIPSQNKGKCQYIANTVQVGEDQEKEYPSVPYYSNCSRSTAEICANTSSEKYTVDDCALVANHSKSDLKKLQDLLDSKGQILSQTALSALIRKRNELALQQRMIEDEIALCDKKIQRMLTDGEDDWELKIESIVAGSIDIWIRNQERTCQHLKDQCLPSCIKGKRLSEAVFVMQSLCQPPCIKRKRLSEAAFVMQSPCQELDGLCHENNWILPTYRISQSDGGLQANVTAKGPNFDCSCGGNVCSNPREARESAAAQMLANLRSMAKSAS